MGSAKFLWQLEKASDQAIQAAAGSWGGRVLKAPTVSATKLINTIEEWLLAGGVDRRQHVTLSGPPGNGGEGVFSVLRTVCASLYTESAGGCSGIGSA